MNPLSANVILVLHFVWATWMVLGVVLAIAGFRWRRLWRWRVFRITHLVGILGTATVPFWAGGICPLTRWEWQMRADGNPGSADPFIINWMREVLFIDLDPIVLSVISALGALMTLIVFFWHPPRSARV